MKGHSRGKVAIVFGGARGIGAATARALHDEGASVVIGDVLIEEGEGTAAGIHPTRCRFEPCDVSSEADIDAVYDAAIAHFGGVDIVVNNVGITRYGRVDELSVDDWELTLRTNLTAQFISVRRAVRCMRERGGGVIVNTASILGHASQKTTAAYAASKAGVMALTRTVAVDHAHEGIRCVSISPATIDTPLARITSTMFEGRDPEDVRAQWAAAHPLNRLGTPEEVAAAIAFLVSPAAGFITGSDILIDGGVRSEIYA